MEYCWEAFRKSPLLKAVLPRSLASADFCRRGSRVLLEAEAGAASVVWLRPGLAGPFGGAPRFSGADWAYGGLVSPFTSSGIARGTTSRCGMTRGSIPWRTF